MSNNIANSVNTIIGKYIDPQTKKPFNKYNPDINTNIKDGHVNVSININPIYKDNYTQIIVEMKNELKKIDNVLSANIILTSEKIPTILRTNIFKIFTNLLAVYQVTPDATNCAVVASSVRARLHHHSNIRALAEL